MGSQFQILKFKPKRTFGVEMEWSSEGPNLNRMRDTIQSFPGEFALVTGYCRNNRDDTWFCKTDSSCGHEVASRVLGSLSDSKKTIEDLKLVGEVHTKLRQIGARVNEHCGGHVHIGMADLSREQFAKFLMYWVKFEKIVLDMMPKRRKRNRYCAIHSPTFRAGTTYDLNSIRRGFDGRNSINLGYYDWNSSNPSMKRIEVRIGEGSDDFRDMKNWIRFLLFFIDRVKDLPAPENLHWYWSFDGLKLLGLMNDDRSKEFYILSPAISELREWILARMAAYANLRDGEKVRQWATEVHDQLYPTPYGMRTEPLQILNSLSS